jgi:hypothetical protein
LFGERSRTRRRDVIDDFAEAHAMRDLREYRRSSTSHFPRIAVHHTEVGSDMRRQIHFVDHE